MFHRHRQYLLPMKRLLLLIIKSILLLLIIIIPFATPSRIKNSSSIQKQTNVFILIGIDRNQIHQLIRTCLIEDANAIRLLVTDEQTLLENVENVNQQTSIRECHHKKYDSSIPQNYCVHSPT